MAKPIPPPPPVTADQVFDYEYEERAAIMEFDGNMPGPLAEARARADRRKVNASAKQSP